MNRRDFLGGIALASLTGCARRVRTAAAPSIEPLPKLMPIRADLDRIFRVTVCLRPFRAAGPRLEVERVGDKTVVHNYGHGGSGWSLSWGSSSVAVEKAMAVGEKDVAVIGCGALGLTSAILLQRAGAKVTIYAKERPPEVRSARATGSWTPDSRIALTNSVAPDFPALWEKMCRTSFHMYESYLGMAGNPVEWTDRYALWDDERAGPERKDALDFARFQNRVRDLTPRGHELPPGSHPFPTRHASRNSSLTFNIAGYSRQLVNDFLVEGGRIERTEFHTPSELSQLTQKVVINATGSFALGFLTGLALYHAFPKTPKVILGTGLCGAYTTFSTFTFETVRLAEDGSSSEALRNLLGTLVVGAAAAAAGLALASL